MNRKRIVCMLFFAILSPFLPVSLAFAAPPSFSLPQPTIETLSSGMKVIWFINDKLPLVDLALIVRSGSRHNLPGKSGTAQLLVNTLDRGSTQHSALEIARSIETLGANRLISVEEENFSVSLHGLAIDAAPLLSQLAEISLHATFPESEVQKQREQMVDALGHIPDYPPSLASLLFQRLMNANSPYPLGHIASLQELKTLTRQDLLRYHQTHFRSSNALLLVLGRIAKDSFRNQIESEFKLWPNTPLPAELLVSAPKAYPFTALAKERKLKPKTAYFINSPSANQTVVTIGLPVASPQTAEHASVVLLNVILGELFNSRLNSIIRDQMGLTYSIQSSLQYEREFTTLEINASTQASNTPVLINKIYEILESFSKGEVADSEIQTAKTYLSGSFPVNHSTLESIATRWMGSYLLDLPSDYLQLLIPKILALTPEQIRKDSHKIFYWNPKTWTCVGAGPRKEIEKSIVKTPLNRKWLSSNRWVRFEELL